MGFFDLLFANITGAVKVCLILAAALGLIGMIAIKITRGSYYDTGGVVGFDGLDFCCTCGLSLVIDIIVMIFSLLISFGFTIASVVLGSVSGGMLGARMYGGTLAVVSGAVIGLVIFGVYNLILLKISGVFDD